MVFEAIRKYFRRGETPTDTERSSYYTSAVSHRNFWANTPEAKKYLDNLKKAEGTRKREFYEDGDIAKDKLIKNCERKAKEYEKKGEFENSRTMYSFIGGLVDNWREYGRGQNVTKAEEMVKRVLDNDKRVIDKMVKKSDPEEERKRLSGLERTAVTTAIIGLIGGTLFLSSSITGNVIGLNQTSSNWLGGILFLVGLVGAFVYFKKRK